VVTEFVRLAAKNGIDVFRVFDCFNDIEQMRVCIDAVRAAGKVAEVGRSVQAVCVRAEGLFFIAAERTEFATHGVVVQEQCIFQLLYIQMFLRSRVTLEAREQQGRDLCMVLRGRQDGAPVAFVDPFF